MLVEKQIRTKKWSHQNSINRYNFIWETL